TVTGKVTDSHDKTPLAGVAIIVKGQKKSALSDDAGNFTIAIQPNDVLVISHIGYLPTEITPTEGTLTVQLERDTKTMNEVVVTALGISKQSKALGYAVQSINTKQLTQAPDPNLINNLAGKLAGV